jgi:phosphoglycerate kinase
MFCCLENVRFHAGEEKNDPGLAKQFAELADVYVNDAFGSAHRAHSSTEGVAHHVSAAVAGFLMEKELTYLHDELQNPERPFVVILGGAKVSDKIGVIDVLLDKADVILIGGGMAYTFRAASGQQDRKLAVRARQIRCRPGGDGESQGQGGEAFAAERQSRGREARLRQQDRLSRKHIDPDADIDDGWEGVDIGPVTIKQFSEEVAKAKTILWNGPMGVFEIKDCAEGTFAIAHAVAANQGAKTIIGGGDSVKAVKKAGVADKVTFISTWRRREPRTPRRQGPPRSRCPEREVIPKNLTIRGWKFADANALIPINEHAPQDHRRELEDEYDRQRVGRFPRDLPHRAR